MTDKRYSITFTADQLSALDDAIEFARMARDGLDGYEARVFSEVVGKVGRAYARSTADAAQDG